MAELKTLPTTQSAEDFLQTIEPEQKRQEGFELLRMYEEITGEKAVMWGTSIVGFGKYHYKSERSRQEGDWPLVGFSPRRQNLTLYVLSDGVKPLLLKLGKHKTSVACLYITKLSDVDRDVLKEVIRVGFDDAKRTHLGQ